MPVAARTARTMASAIASAASAPSLIEIGGAGARAGREREDRIAVDHRDATGKSRARIRRAPSARASWPALWSASHWSRRRRSSCSRAMRLARRLRHRRLATIRGAASPANRRCAWPSSVRAPAMNRPVAGSMTLPDRVDRDQRGNDESLRAVRSRRCRCRPSCRDPIAAACRPSRPRRRRRCLRHRVGRCRARRGSIRNPRPDESVRRRPDRSNRIAAGTIGTTHRRRWKADVLLFEVFDDAVRGRETERAAAREHDRVHLFDEIRRG